MSPSPGAPPDTNPWWAHCAAIGLAVAAPSASWSWVGDRSIAGDDLDYLWTPPALTQSQESAIFAASTLLVAVALAVLLAGQAMRLLRPPLLAGCAVVTAFGLLLGAGYRVVTAGVIGANIGGGLVLLAAIPATLLALATFVVVTVAPSGRRQRHPTHR